MLDKISNNMKAAKSTLKVSGNKAELLCPAGSVAAFDAAIEAGADAIYIGGTAFNARINAKNFTDDDMKSAIRRAHAYGVRVYIAANTLIYDRELEAYLASAEKAYSFGADALIVADIGAARLLKKHLPELELHASTQASGHNVAAARVLSEAGFSRMVCAREASRSDLSLLCSESPIETEVFVHGALCVCHSGQCLFSSLIGGRSGNRGECAQPCRLPYRTPNGMGYPLSLKDLCLAGHVRELLDMGVDSFKIEGRMKSPEYVRDVASIWRRLIDERRDATEDEMEELARIFSRGGFTDGYYTRTIGKGMRGVRSEDNKRDTRELVPFDKITRKIPISLSAKIKAGEPMELYVAPYGVSVSGDIPLDAINAPTDAETVKRCLLKLGGTPYEAKEISLELDGGLMIPISRLNSLRRAAIEKISALSGEQRELPEREPVRIARRARQGTLKTAVFYDSSRVAASAKEYFDVIYLPLDKYDGSTEGVIFPSVIFDSERESVEKYAARASELGAKYALVGNIGHIDIAKKYGFALHGDMRLNVSNDLSARVFEELGFEYLLLSPELTLPQMRDIGGTAGSVVYGRIPLMVTELCVGKALGSCEDCKSGRAVLTDRKNVSFPIARELPHRSLIFNSVPFFMADKLPELDRAGLSNRHFVFTDESASEVDRVIECYERGLPFDKPFRRMN